MDAQFSLKELYEVRLKTTYSIEFNGKNFVAGETIGFFDSIQIANFQEIKSASKATGGYDNRSLIYWDYDKELKLTLTQGVFSKEQWALMTNAKLINEVNPNLELTQREILETDENKQICLKHSPTRNIFIYDKITGNKIINYSLENNIITLENAYQEVIIDYNFIYNSQYQNMIIGQKLTEGYLELEGRAKIQDDITGHFHTGIIKIPKLKLMSDISMRLGRNATPIVEVLQAVAFPTGERENKKIMEILFLDDDIDSDL